MKTWIVTVSLLLLALFTVRHFAIADASDTARSKVSSQTSTPNGGTLDPSTATLIGDSEIRPLTSSDNGTLTVGLTTVSGCHASGNLTYGFVAAKGTGSYSPTGLTGGRTVVAVYDIEAGGCVPSISVVSISGFSSDPGSSWLSSTTCNGIQNIASGASYVYGSGNASWEWTQLFGLQSKNGSNVSCTIVHN
jgi:hypothetical protein